MNRFPRNPVNNPGRRAPETVARIHLHSEPITPLRERRMSRAAAMHRNAGNERARALAQAARAASHKRLVAGGYPRNPASPRDLSLGGRPRGSQRLAKLAGEDVEVVQIDAPV